MAKDKPGHTKGPWKLRVDKYENYEVIDEQGREIADAYWDNDDGPTTAEAKANAELIQAAPELAEALRLATRELNAIRARDGAPQHITWDRGRPMQTGSCTEEWWDELTEKCLAALRKAGYEAGYEV